MKPIKRFPKDMIIESAPQNEIAHFPEEIARILDAIGYADAFVTDWSTIYDFALDPLDHAIAEDALGLTFRHGDTLVSIAARLRNIH